MRVSPEGTARESKCTKSRRLGTLISRQWIVVMSQILDEAGIPHKFEGVLGRRGAVLEWTPICVHAFPALTCWANYVPPYGLE